MSDLIFLGSNPASVMRCFLFSDKISFILCSLRDVKKGTRTFPFTVQLHPTSLHQVLSFMGLSGLQDLKGHHSSFPVSGYWASFFRVALRGGAATRIFQIFSHFCIALAGKETCQLMKWGELDEGA